MRVAPPILLTDEQRQALAAAAASRTASVRFAQRARMILLAADGKQDIEIAAEVGTRRQAVARWRRRFLELGIDGIAKDAPRGGRRRSARTEAKVRAITPALVESPLQLVPSTLGDDAGALGAASLAMESWVPAFVG